MDRVQKFIRKLGKERGPDVTSIMHNIVYGNIADLDVKKLKGANDIYRVRVGNIRIIFKRTREGNEVLDVGFRNDHTY